MRFLTIGAALLLATPALGQSLLSGTSGKDAVPIQCPADDMVIAANADGSAYCIPVADLISPPDPDTDPTNELNTGFAFDLASGDLTITDAGGSLVQNLNGLKSDPITFCNPATGAQVPLRTATMPALNSRESSIVVGTGTGVTLSDGTGLEAIVEGGGYTEIFRIPGTELVNPNQCRTMRYICGYRGASPRMQTDNDRFNLRITGLGNGVPTITFDTSSTLTSDPVSADDFEWDGGWPITQFSVHVVPPGGTVTLPDIVYELERELGEPDGRGFETFLGEQGVAPFCLGAAT